MTNWKIIGFFFAGTLILLLLLRWQGRTLYTPAAPKGIVSLELSSNPGAANAIAHEWRPTLINAFRWNMLLDFFVIPFYGLFLYSLCGYFSVLYKQGIFQRAGVLMAFGSLMAMLFDAGENILMIISIHWVITPVTTLLTSVFAVLKFGLILLAILYILVSAVCMLLGKWLSGGEVEGKG
ncbi:MAG: hypothetical protein KF746_09390 [Chitinophagaceae bacterium]|nr:hypothetical protein [Chitinophagaceae bacterium]